MADSSHVDSNVITSATDSSGSTVVAVVQTNVTESTQVTSNITAGGKGDTGATGASTISTVTKTGNYTLTSTDDVVLGDTTSGTITITLPTAVGVTKLFSIKKITSANTLNIATTSSQTIDGSTTIAITAQNESITMASNNSNWSVI